MAQIWRTRMGAVPALATPVVLNVNGANAAPGNIVVPANAKCISRVIVEAAADHSAVGGVVWSADIQGDGVGPNKPYAFAVGGAGGQVNNRGQYSVKPKIYKTAIPVVTGNEIIIRGTMHGDADPGSSYVSVTVVFDTIQAPVMTEAWRFRAAAMAVNATEYEATLDESGVAVARMRTPGGCRQIVAAGVCMTSNAAGVGIAMPRVSLQGDGVPEQPQEFPGPAFAGQLVTSDPDGNEAMGYDDMNIPVVQGQVVPFIAFNGNDTGTCTAGVCVCFR